MFMCYEPEDLARYTHKQLLCDIPQINTPLPYLSLLFSLFIEHTSLLQVLDLLVLLDSLFCPWQRHPIANPKTLNSCLFYFKNKTKHLTIEQNIHKNHAVDLRSVIESL